MTIERTLDAEWDGFVAACDPGSYLQLSGWARVKAVNGWRSRRVVVDGADGRIGAEVLLRRPWGIPWAFAYAPRGPVAAAPLRRVVRRLPRVRAARSRGRPAQPSAPAGSAPVATPMSPCRRPPGRR